MSENRFICIESIHFLKFHCRQYGKKTIQREEERTERDRRKEVRKISYTHTHMHTRGHTLLLKIN